MAEEIYKTNKQRLLEQNNESKIVNDIRYDTREYPDGLLGTSRYPHFTMFFINVNSKGKIAKNDDGRKTVNVDPRDNTSGAATSIALQANERDESVSAFVRQLASDITSGATHKRLKQSICLPMPLKVSSNLDATYNMVDVGPLGAIITSVISGQGVTEAVGKVALNAVAKGASALIKNATGYKPNNTEAMLNKLTGSLLNPRQEQVFKQMQFREYELSYVLIPRTKSESDAINDIIRLFRSNMLPEVNNWKTDNSVLVMPSEFDIDFRFKSERNKAIPRVATCALKSVHVDYTPIGEFVAFEGTDNPVAIALRLLFVELEPIMRNMVEEGGF